MVWRRTPALHGEMFQWISQPASFGYTVITIIISIYMLLI